MELKQSAKFVKYLLILQTLIVIGIGICEVIQLAEINKSQPPITNHPNDWNYLIGYTNSIIAIIMRIYYWFVILISIGILGWSLDSFEKRWKNFQGYSDNSKNMTLLVLWCIATIPSIIFLSTSNGIRTCSASSYSYAVTPKLLLHCNAYLASLLLAYILIFTVIIQLLFHLVIIKHHQKKISMKPPPNLQGPKKVKVRRSKRVSKKRNSSLRSSVVFSLNSTRLSIVTEDVEEKSNKSNRSNRSSRSSKSSKSYESVQGEFNNEKQVNSNV